MRRRSLLSMLLAGCVSPVIAQASGGLDVEDSGTPKTVRVLLGSNVSTQPTRLTAWDFSWNGRTYRGDFAFAPLADGRMGLVNTLPLDAYLYGVISQELSEGWPQATQEAQTIAARTYALKRLRPDRPYDVVAGKSNQSYGGIDGETVAGRAAIDATAGTIVTYAGAPADIAYSACCGGHTADAANVWGTNVPYLHGVVDPNCVGSPGYSWKRNVPLETLSRVFGSHWTTIGALSHIDLRAIDDSGRPRVIAFLGDRGSLEVRSEDLRSWIGSTIVRSTLIHSATVQGNDVALEGNGFGHGVGLCQWGARAMGLRGVSAADILSFYFPSTSLAQA